MRASGDVNAVRDAVGITEIELRCLTVQMLLAAMLVDALHATLEDTVEAFDRVSVNLWFFALNILAGAVRGKVIARKRIGQLSILFRFIGMNRRLFGDVLAQN